MWQGTLVILFMATLFLLSETFPTELRHSILKLATAGSFETLAPTYQTTRRHVPDDLKFFTQNHNEPLISNFRRITVISGFRRYVDEICALLGCYAASNGNPLPTFPYNISAPSSRVKKSRLLDRR
jgi:hypothetical protein